MFTVIFCSWEAKINLLDNSNSLFLEKYFVEEYPILSSYKYNAHGRGNVKYYLKAHTL